MASFPPPSIAVDGIVDSCEQVEMLANCPPELPIVEMAALLYKGDTIHARHLYRRYRGDGTPTAIQTALAEWWRLGRAMTECDVAQIWTTLKHLQQTQPKPYCDYAQEIGNAFCRRLIPKLALIWNDTNSKQEVLLGLPRQEWAAFLEQHRASLLEEAKASQGHVLGSSHTSDIIVFLESPTLRI